MAETYIWKPSTISSWKRGIAFLAPQEGSREPPVITTQDGRTFTGKYVNTNEGRHQFIFPPELANEQGLQVSYGGQTSTIENGAVSYEGSSLGNWQAREKGSLGSPGGMGVPSGFEPGTTGFGAFPAYLGGQFPQPTFATFKSIKAAPYKYTDPFEFGERYGEFARGEIQKGFGLSKDIAMEALDTELKGLQTFAPAAAALKRQETSIDNLFNQAERTRQIESTLPGVRAELASQTGRAATYARGRLTDEAEDRALELGMRSRAADTAFAGGFGARSSVARKASDLMSAEERFKISQYGEGLLGQNVQTRAGLELAPTSYSDAGAQIRVTPEVGGGRLFTDALGRITEQTTIPATTAFQTDIQQNQFRTGLIQQTRQFNATGQFQASQFNAGVANQFALGQFGYNVGYANSVAGAAQTDINTGIALQQQEDARKTYEDAFENSQNTGMIRDITSLLTGLGMYLASPSRGRKPSQGGGPSQTGTNIVEGTQPPAPGGFDFIPSIPDVGGAPSFTEPEPFQPPLEPGDTYTTERPEPVLPEPPSPGFPEDNSDFSVRTLASNYKIPENQVRLLQDFQKNTGVNVKLLTTPAEVRQATVLAAQTMAAGGVYNVPVPGSEPAGYDASGRPVFTDTALKRNQTTEPGRVALRTTADVLNPFTNFTVSDRDRMLGLDKLLDPAFMKTLDTLSMEKDSDRFVRLLTRALKTSTTKKGAARG